MTVLQSTIREQIARSLIRYVSGALVSAGIVSTTVGAYIMGSPEVLGYLLMGAGVVAATLTEVWFAKSIT